MSAEIVVRTAGGQETHPIRGSRVVIGRGVNAHIRLADAMASREHCVVEPSGDRFVLRDLGSANGTLVNGARVDERVLEPGDRIEIGESALVFVLERPRAEEGAGVDIGEDASSIRVQSFVLRATEVDLGAAGREALAGDYLRILHDLTTMPSLKDSVSEVCDTLLKTLLRSGRFGRAAVVLCDPAGAATERFTRSEKGAPPRVALDGAELTGLFRSGESVFRRGVAWERRTYACMMAPLKGRDAVHGVLYVDDLLASGGLQEPELHLVSAIGLQVGLLIENIQYARRLQREKDTLQDMVAAEADIVGESRAIQRVMELVRRVAPTESTVLVRGESGTGKELVARSLHLNSARRAGPLEIVNCAALPPSLIESELFGHEKGSFTGATARRKGRFEMAAGGTLFLDEVGELAAEAQAKLLRIVEDRRVRRVGAVEEVPVDVRLVAATHRDLSELVASRAFREDLYYRLNVVEILIPPLRERAEDVDALAQHFLEAFARKMGRRLAGLTVEARQLLRRHVWPGNVRELRNVMERAVLLGAGPALDAGDFPSLLASPPLGREVPTLEEVERNHIAKVLAAAGGNKSEAARLLGVNRSTLYEKLERHRLGS